MSEVFVKIDNEIDTEKIDVIDNDVIDKDKIGVIDKDNYHNEKIKIFGVDEETKYNDFEKTSMRTYTSPRTDPKKKTAVRSYEVLGPASLRPRRTYNDKYIYSSSVESKQHHHMIQHKKVTGKVIVF
ncbi:unnamed protein product [Rhizophagus irregularis]|nr:unnamed protein product [Rhizophagus irregularis]